MYRFNWIIFFARAVQPVFFSASAAHAGEKPLSITIRENLGQVIRVEKDIQNMRNNWPEQSKTMADQLQALETQASELEKHLEKMDLRLKLEQDRLDKNLRREKETDRMKADLNVFWDSVLLRL